MTRYTTYGSVCGGCSHKHRTIETAERCADRHQRELNSVRGYSDRRVLPIDADELPIWYRYELEGRR